MLEEITVKSRKEVKGKWRSDRSGDFRDGEALFENEANVSRRGY
jgi:hypothetical protein